jgi:hypothetical protein
MNKRFRACGAGLIAVALLLISLYLIDWFFLGFTMEEGKLRFHGSLWSVTMTVCQAGAGCAESPIYLATPTSTRVIFVALNLFVAAIGLQTASLLFQQQTQQSLVRFAFKALPVMVVFVIWRMIWPPSIEVSGMAIALPGIKVASAGYICLAGLAAAAFALWLGRELDEADTVTAVSTGNAEGLSLSSRSQRHGGGNENQVPTSDKTAVAATTTTLRSEQHPASSKRRHDSPIDVVHYSDQDDAVEHVSLNDAVPPADFDINTAFRGKVQFAAATATFSKTAAVVRLINGDEVAMDWREIVRISCRRLPLHAPFYGIAFVDLFTSQSVTRILSLTRVDAQFDPGNENRQQSPSEMHPFIVAIRQRCPSAAMDSATEAYVSTAVLPAAFASDDVLAQYDNACKKILAIA